MSTVRFLTVSIVSSQLLRFTRPESGRDCLKRLLDLPGRENQTIISPMPNIPADTIMKALDIALLAECVACGPQ